MKEETEKQGTIKVGDGYFLSPDGTTFRRLFQNQGDLLELRINGELCLRHIAPYDGSLIIYFEKIAIAKCNCGDLFTTSTTPTVCPKCEDVINVPTHSGVILKGTLKGLRFKLSKGLRRIFG